MLVVLPAWRLGGGAVALGEIIEAASAADSVSVSVDADVAESATADSAQDGSVVVNMATWDPATVTAVTLSGGNLIATNTGTTSADQGAHVAAASGKTTGKYYYEVTLTAYTGGAPNLGMGIGTTSSTYTNMGNSATTGNVVYKSGAIWANGGSTSLTLGARSVGDILGVAVDLGARKIWFRVAPSGNWNGQAIGSQNPATGTGGATIPAGTMVPFVVYGGSLGAANNIWTANFGASAFSGAVPSGFTSGWPV
jgi:hypothetical protein